jgi:hypothetical protein
MLMKQAVQKLFSLIYKTDPARKMKARKSRGQSMVEVAIVFPLLIMLFSGMVEFGFMLNTYLSLLDATRQTARAMSNTTPFVSIDDSTSPPTIVDDMDFYDTAVGLIIDTLAPPGAGTEHVRKIVFDPSRDDIIISVLRVSVDEPTPPALPSIVGIERFPQGLANPYYQAFGNHLSAYSDNSRIEDLMTKNGTTPVRTGILIIEIYYGYDGVLKLPWVEAFLDTITLHADTVMPLVTAKPPRITPTP